MRESDDFLEHFGVKGMRWGVTRKKNDTRSDEQKASDKARRNQKILATAVLGSAAMYEIGVTLYTDSLNTKSREQGQAFVKTMMDAKLKKGVYKVTSM